MEYKDTLNLPKTDFPMKADLPKREPQLLDAWQAQGLYGQIRRQSAGRPHYVLHDGPPYANGDIHIGHALNKTLKDIIIKFRTMQGYDSPYVPGWDCHGLPVEHQLFKELKMNKYQIDQLEFRKKAYEYASRYVSIQRDEFKRLGVLADWDNPYLTIDPAYEEAIIRSFQALVEKGYIYRGLKPVNWCFRDETALAEAEVEYEDHTSPSIYVKFKLEPHKDFAQDTYLVIWTTTPWTLLANVAVAVHPHLTYAYIKTDKGNLVVASGLAGKVMEQIGAGRHEVVRELPGKDLEGLTYEHPFGIRTGRVVLADYVARDEGTGLVHTAPGHGAEDFMTGQKYKLDIIMPVDAKGRFDASVPDFAGQNVLEANAAILEKLLAAGALLFSASITHSYPHCWRCKHPVIFRATKQWFLNIDARDLRKKLLGVIQGGIEFIPAAGKERIAAMVQTRPDWCLSRQRYWGVPIPALVCTKCHEEVLEPRVIGKFAGYAAQEGSDCWFKRDTGDFVPEGFTCPSCGGSEFTKGADILDVWFDSGVSHQAVLKKRKELAGVPCELYLEGSDQHRGWFQASLIPGMCIDGAPPFKAVLTHGFVVDGEGRKMSKSLGNVISPFGIIKDYGADILRLWVASSDYNEDIRISPEILKRLSEAYRKIRNTARFILSNLYDFDPDKDRVEYSRLKKIDAWILCMLERRVVDAAAEAYGKFEFYKAYQAIYEFCNMELSSFYLDIAKGRLYTYAASSPERRAAQTALYEVLNVLVRVTAPLLVFTAEEIWQHMPKEKNDKAAASVHLLSWPRRDPVFAQDELFAKGQDIVRELQTVKDLVPAVNEKLEGMRGKGEIGSSFDARINLLTNNENRYKQLESLKGDLPEIFKVSEVQVKLDQACGDMMIEVAKAQGIKCVRCWNYKDSVGKNQEHAALCDTCINAIRGRT